MFDNDYILLEKVLDSSNGELKDSSDDPIWSRLFSDILRKFMEGMPSMFSVSDKLKDNSSNGIYPVQDSKSEEVKDSQTRTILSRYYSSEQILDSLGKPIDCRAIFIN